MWLLGTAMRSWPMTGYRLLGTLSVGMLCRFAFLLHETYAPVKVSPKVKLGASLPKLTGLLGCG